MNYVIFARKFRPQTFEEILGQEPIVTTLQNAIRQERISQSFLFSGPRGIGKTSTARILAKALNCEKGPTPKPCGKCAACTEITQTNSMDVLEIDGASNRGIDEIRNLRETVKFKPVHGRYKVYVIDEVHMLTTEAFNALLKTLEEPPPHVKFIFATTEPHKVPLTILSRCQRFNFKRIPTHQIAEKLEEIARAEKIKCDQKSIFLIAKSSEGALRDAEGLLDQLASFSDKKIKGEDVLQALGMASEDVYFRVLSALCEKDAGRIFSIVNELYEGGRDLVQFAKGLLELFRNLLLLQCADDIEKFIEMSGEGIAGLKKRKNDFSRSELLLALSLLGNLQSQLRRNLANPKLLVETALLKLLHVDGLKSLETAPAKPDSQVQAPPPPREKPAGKPSSPEPSGPVQGTPRASLETPETPRGGTLPPSAPGADIQLNNVEAVWSRVIEYVKAKRMSTGIFLSESAPVEVDGTVVTLGLPAEFQFHREMLEKDSNRQLIEEAFSVMLQAKVRVQVVVTVAERKEEKVEAPEADKSPLPEIITQALEIFEGAKVIRKEP